MSKLEEMKKIRDELFDLKESPLYEERVKNNVLKYCKDSILITVAHRIPIVKNFDVIYVINNGSIVGSGTHDELIKNNSYYIELNKSYDNTDIDPELMMS